MTNDYHRFHIPVMGTGHSADTSVRVAHLGITSVISLVDDILLEQLRAYYSREYDLSYDEIGRDAEDGRARRITAYLNTVREIVEIKVAAIRRLPFFQNNEKARYFALLPDDSPLKADYERFLKMKAGTNRDVLEQDLTSRMRPGSIDVNIMVKLDRRTYDRNGNLLDEDFSDARSALRGFANSVLEGSMVFSAGINRTLFDYLSRFKDFYRDQTGKAKKKIILKVSDFRSALVQGRVLAKAGLEVYKFYIESGLNCGGHAFASNGHLLPCLLREFKEKRAQLQATFQPLVRKFYEKMGWDYPAPVPEGPPRLAVQGGIGTHGEVRRLLEDFQMDQTGWATPFLLVPEATAVDAPTRELLRRARKEDLYLSDVSPIGVPFSNVRGTGSELWTRQQTRLGRPGSPCAKGFLVSNTEFTEQPICLASRRYQALKLQQIDALPVTEAERQRMREDVLVKMCICDHLGSGIKIVLGIADEKHAPQSVCPGPNIAWFDRFYSLQEMVDHIYGRRPSVVPAERPHMFAAEVVIYVDYFEKLVERCLYTDKEVQTLQDFRNNLEAGMDYCLEIAQREPFPDENLASIRTCVEDQRERLNAISAQFERGAGAKVR